MRDGAAGRADGRLIYFGLWQPHAAHISLVGAFNHWQPDAFPLQPVGNGWWHSALRLPPGAYTYRFWGTDQASAAGRWLRDPENPDTAESGYQDAHSQITVH